jgi:hypothetical protein
MEIKHVHTLITCWIFYFFNTFKLYFCVCVYICSLLRYIYIYIYIHTHTHSHAVLFVNTWSFFILYQEIQNSYKLLGISPKMHSNFMCYVYNNHLDARVFPYFIELKYLYMFLASTAHHQAVRCMYTYVVNGTSKMPVSEPGWKGQAQWQ